MILRIPSGYSLPVKIGSGGFGTIYRVRQDAVGRLVVLKLIEIKDRQRRETLKKEASSQAALQMDGIPQVYDVLEYRGHIGIVMQWIKGCNLRTLLEKKGISEPVRFALCHELIRITAALHNRGFAHRDLKPENIIISSNGVYLVDFGLTRNEMTGNNQTITMTIRGTPAYIAPELFQESGTSVDLFRADMFSLGKIITEVFAGEPVPDCVNKCMELLPSKRPASVSELLILWESEIASVSIDWKTVAEPQSSILLSRQLYTAACDCIQKHQFTDAYQLLAETIQIDPDFTDALTLLDRFPLIRQNTFFNTKSIALAIILTSIVLIFSINQYLVISRTKKQSETIGLNTSSTYQRITTPQATGKNISYGYFIDPTPAFATLCGHITFTTDILHGSLFIDNKPISLSRTSIPFSPEAAAHSVQMKAPDSSIVWKEAIIMLPFVSRNIHIRDRR